MPSIILEGTASQITTTTAARLACGVSSVEFPDSAFADSGFVEDLELELNKWLGEASLSYVTIIGLGVAASPSAAERADYLNLKKYAKYYLATQIIRTMNMGLAEQISDGQNVLKRFHTKVDELITLMTASANSAKREILRAHSALPDDMTVLSGAGNKYDPVTDEDEA